MPTAQDIHGSVFDGGTATLLARVVGSSGAAITRADIASIAYSVFLLDDNTPDSRTAVAEHAAESLTVSAVVFDTLQTDAIWTADATGYNFRHTVDVSEAAAFAVAGRRYLVEYTLTPVSGQPIILRFRLNCI